MDLLVDSSVFQNSSNVVLFVSSVWKFSKKPFFIFPTKGQKFLIDKRDEEIIKQYLPKQPLFILFRKVRKYKWFSRKVIILPEESPILEVVSMLKPLMVLKLRNQFHKEEEGGVLTFVSENKIHIRSASSLWFTEEEKFALVPHYKSPVSYEPNRGDYVIPFAKIKSLHKHTYYVSIPLSVFPRSIQSLILTFY